MRLHIKGAVQGVGFRPFVYRLAGEYGISGWVKNSASGVTIEAEGPESDLVKFSARLRTDIPPNASIHSFETGFLAPTGAGEFTIRSSDDNGSRSAIVLPDIALCADCRREVQDPANRRYRYPFTNCTNCGPRYSIINALPYDRPNTSMSGFEMCSRCLKEYLDPADRRFHAQPNACPDCGPEIRLWNSGGDVIGEGYEAVHQLSEALRNGKIGAVKGLGGFHLMADARNGEAVGELRRRKQREEKPLAVMVGSLEVARTLCEVSDQEALALGSPEAPIVLLARKAGAGDVCEEVAPGNPCLGVMLPYTPLHLLITSMCGFPLVATSGNLSDEPICIDEREALERLKNIADVFLVHNRPIVRHVDDSIVRVMAGRVTVLRRARGYAPLPVLPGVEFPEAIAVGGHLKSAVAVSGRGTGAVVSQHIGDLDTLKAREAFERELASVVDLYEFEPGLVACDLHPDYFTTHFAYSKGLPVEPVQHHYAHVLACMAENEIEGPVLGVAWDGTGYGTDGSIWGGEFLCVDGSGFKRLAHLRQFRLPGGDSAVKEPRRSALGVLVELYGPDLDVAKGIPTLSAFPRGELDIARKMLEKEVNSPRTSSAGRLFDAVASITGIRQFTGFEGQAAMELEFNAGVPGFEAPYDFELIRNGTGPAEIDWRPMVRSVVSDVRKGVSAETISRRFHNTLSEIIVAVAAFAKEPRIALSGGCFQNKYLLETTVGRLEQEGFSPYFHQKVPPNDGGLALGQLYAAALLDRAKEKD